MCFYIDDITKKTTAVDFMRVSMKSTRLISSCHGDYGICYAQIRLW